MRYTREDLTKNEKRKKKKERTMPASLMIWYLLLQMNTVSGDWEGFQIGPQVAKKLEKLPK
jgi:hypothetical protein